MEIIAKKGDTPWNASAPEPNRHPNIQVFAHMRTATQGSMNFFPIFGELKNAGSFYLLTH